MQFLNPYILFGLLAIAIPVIIHLFNFRRYRKVYFSNVRFLRELREKNRKQSQLLHYLILAARILTLAFLVLAFAHPYLRRDRDKVMPAQHAVSVFIDNSFSMEAEAARGKLLDEAKQRALSLARAYKADDMFQLLTNDFEGKHQRLVTRDEFLKMVEEITVSPSVRTMQEITARQRDLFATSRIESKEAYLLSDFQQSTVLRSLPDSITDMHLTLVPLKAGELRNIFIDSAWVESPVLRAGQVVPVKVRISNISDMAMEKIPVSLAVDGRQRAVGTADLPPDGSAVIDLPFRNDKGGNIDVSISLTDHPVTYDDTWYMALRITGKIPVMNLSGQGENSFIRSVFGLDSVFSYTYTPAGQADLSRLKDYDLIVLDRLSSVSSGMSAELGTYVSEGGSLMVFPSSGAEPAELNRLLASVNSPLLGEKDTSRMKAASLNLNHPVFQGVFGGTIEGDNMDLPQVTDHYRLAASNAGNTESLIRLLNGLDLLTVSRYGNGKVYVAAAPLEDDAGNWARHATFVPLMLNIGFQSVISSRTTHLIGTNEPIDVGSPALARDNVFKFVSLDGQYSFIPQYRRLGNRNVVLVNDQIKQAGIYKVFSGNDEIGRMAFNYNRAESHLKSPDLAALKALVQNMDNLHVFSPGPRELDDMVAERNKGKKLWKWFLIGSLFFLLTETILLRLLHERQSRPQVSRIEV